MEHCLTVDREKNAMVLLDLPMNKEEEGIVEEVLRKIGGNVETLARDTLLVRWASKGRLAELLEAAGGQGVESEGKAAGVNWGDLRRGVKLGMGVRMGLAEVTGH